MNAKARAKPVTPVKKPAPSDRAAKEVIDQKHSPLHDKVAPVSTVSGSSKLGR